MPTIEFDVHGNVKPYTVILLTIDEFRKEFVEAFPYSERRSFLFDTLLNKHIDGYFVQIYPEEHHRRNWYESDRLCWLQDFGTSLAGRKEGIIELNF